jgi:glyoxylase-like metal-dependent hydrolase (beta-lactamase superfamily II)
MNVSEIAPGVHAVQGRLVNWLILLDGSDVTLLDTGYPGDRDEVEASLRAVGRSPQDVRAVLLTHAHTDHIGNAARYAESATVLAHPAELAQVRGEVHHQVSPLAIAKNAWRPNVLPWAVQAARNGGLGRPTVADPKPVPLDGDALDVPGHPVPVPTPGHTPGSCCYYLREHGVLATGDSLVTGHPVSPRRGPQLISPMFQHDAELAAESLAALRGLPGELIVPGHGPVHRGPIGAAVLAALVDQPA